MNITMAAAIMCFGLWCCLYTLIKFKSSVPWSVIIVTIGIVIGYMDNQGYLSLHLTTLKDRYGMLQPVLMAPNLTTDIPVHHWWTITVASCSVAFVSVLETIISGKIADHMTQTSMDQRQEVIGLALANVASGVTGGIPATAALARTSLNIKSGAHTKLSAIINAVCTGMFAYMVMPLFSYMPLLVVSALLFQVCVGMIDSKHLIDSFQHDRAALIRTLLVAGIACAVDPTSGIVVGAILGLLDSADTLATGFCEVIVTNDFQQYWTIDAQRIDQFAVESVKPTTPMITRLRHMLSHSDNVGDMKLREQVSAGGWHAAIYRPVGSLCYLSTLSHASRIRSLRPSTYFILSMRFVDHIDMDGVTTIHQILRELESRGLTVIIATLAPRIHDRLMVASWFQDMVSSGKVFASLVDATQVLKPKNSTV